MITIQEEDFLLESVGSSSYFFDLSLMGETVKKDSGVINEYKLVAYGVPLQRALAIIAKNRALNGTGKISVDEYVSRYEKACKELSKVKVK